MNTLLNSAAIVKGHSIVQGEFEPDLPFHDQQHPLVLLQALSPQVISGDPCGAMAGMFTGRLGDEQVLLAEFTLQLVGFILSHPQFAPDQKAPIADYGVTMPCEARFHYAQEGYPRSGFYLPNRNQVVPTITAWILVNHDGLQHPSALRFSRSSYRIGRELYTRASKLKAVVEGEQVRGCPLAKYSMTAVPETRNSKTYFVPKPTLLGVVGEPAGPTLPEFRFADQLRRAF
jgi:hypothetical protein